METTAMQCGLLGEKLGHSYSPELHALLGDYPYALYEVAPKALGDFLRAGDFHGLNVTIPYKTTLAAVCDELTEAAGAIGSVNTVLRRPDGTLLGDNTDAAGFEAMVKASGIRVRGKKCLVFGSGGASKSICYVLEKLGAGEIVVISRSGEDNYDNLDRHADAQVLVNATPLGMYPDTAAAPADLRDFPACEGVLDVVYNPARTALLQQAEVLDIPCREGCRPGAPPRSSSGRRSPWSGRRPPATSSGPGRRTGSSSACPAAASPPWAGPWRTGWTAPSWTPTPSWRSCWRCPAGSLHQGRGEPAFRAHETALLEKLGKAVRPGHRHRRRRGHPAGELPPPPPERPADLPGAGALQAAQEGRPLSQRGALEDLYTIRLPMYRRFADCIVPNAGTPEDVARAVEEAYEALSH